MMYDRRDKEKDSVYSHRAKIPHLNRLIGGMYLIQHFIRIIYRDQISRRHFFRIS